MGLNVFVAKCHHPMYSFTKGTEHLHQHRGGVRTSLRSAILTAELRQWWRTRSGVGTVNFGLETNIDGTTRPS